MSVNAAAALIGAVVIAILISYRVWEKKKREQFREELIDKYSQEGER